MLPCIGIISLPTLSFACSCLMSSLERDIDMACVFPASKVTPPVSTSLDIPKLFPDRFYHSLGLFCKYVCEMVQSSSYSYNVRMVCKGLLKYMFHRTDHFGKKSQLGNWFSWITAAVSLLWLPLALAAFFFFLHVNTKWLYRDSCIRTKTSSVKKTIVKPGGYTFDL